MGQAYGASSDQTWRQPGIATKYRLRHLGEPTYRRGLTSGDQRRVELIHTERGWKWKIARDRQAVEGAGFSQETLAKNFD